MDEEFAELDLVYDECPEEDYNMVMIEFDQSEVVKLCSLQDVDVCFSFYGVDELNQNLRKNCFFFSIRGVWHMNVLT